jgi:hypothetical protein
MNKEDKELISVLIIWFLLTTALIYLLCILIP